MPLCPVCNVKLFGVCKIPAIRITKTTTYISVSLSRLKVKSIKVPLRKKMEKKNSQSKNWKQCFPHKKLTLLKEIDESVNYGHMHLTRRILTRILKKFKNFA